jgi:hypothetical protein
LGSTSLFVFHTERKKEVRDMSNLLRVLRGPRGTWVILAVVGVVVLAGAATAFAVGEGKDEDHKGSSALKGSVAAPKESGSDDEAAQAQELQKLAKIDQSTAEKSALQAVPGTLNSTKLDNENSFVVYEVEVAGDDGQSHHVQVDAGNGEVLQQDAGGENESGERGE